MVARWRGRRGYGAPPAANIFSSAEIATDMTVSPRSHVTLVAPDHERLSRSRRDPEGETMSGLPARAPSLLIPSAHDRFTDCAFRALKESDSRPDVVGESFDEESDNSSEAAEEEPRRTERMFESRFTFPITDASRFVAVGVRAGDSGLGLRASALVPRGGARTRTCPQRACPDPGMVSSTDELLQHVVTSYCTTGTTVVLLLREGFVGCGLHV